MKYDRIAQTLIAIAFPALLCLPHFSELKGDAANVAAIEKRSTAEAPNGRMLFRSFPDFAKQFDKYYSDSFGMRDDLIYWNNRLRLSLFGESPIRGVKVGLNGWLFYANEWVLEDYENVMPYKAQELANMARIIEERRAWLERRGIKLYIVVAPNKHTIYSEHLPTAIHKIGKESRLDQTASYFAAHPEIEFIDLRQALFEAKPSQRLYHKTDTHWNDYGAFIGYGKLMDRIRSHFPNAKKLTLEDYTVSVVRGKGGDLANMLSLADEIAEERINLLPRFSPKAVDGARSYPDPVDPAEYPGREMVVKETHDAGLPKALIFRDSFSWPLIPFLAESFRSTVFLWTFDFFPEIIEKEKPDIVIFECVERYLSSLGRENPAGFSATAD